MKNAFTLAETLVTLGIIGIVAAMTIPNMVANYKANILHTQLVKAYSILQQALQKMQNKTYLSKLFPRIFLTRRNIFNFYVF